MVKIVGFLALFFLLVAVGVSSFLYFTGYHSAFEADQACHAIQWERFSDSTEYDCDHDIETHQWLLFKRGVDHRAATVIQRFSY